MTADEVWSLVDLAQRLRMPFTARREILAGKSLGMIFQYPSTRTRASFETAMTQLGGHAQFYGPGSLQFGVHEDLADTARALSGFVDGLVARLARHDELLSLAHHAEIPVINGMTDYSHPTQEIADLITMAEATDKPLSACKVVYVGDNTMICRSVANITRKVGMEFVQLGPADLWMQGVWASADREVVKGADFIYTDTWVGDYAAERTLDERRRIFYPHFQVDETLMRMAGSQVKFMHCLPATRGEEVTAEVIDGPDSLVWKQSANRLTAQRAILVHLLGEY